MRPGLIVCAFLLLLGACSQWAPHPDWVQTPATEELQEVLSGASILGRPVQEQDLPDGDVLQLTPAMMRLAEEIAHQYDDSYEQAEALHRTLMSPTQAGGEGLRYSALETASPAEAFEARQVNCISYSMMVVAMARHMGLRAEINEVEVPPSWSQRGDDSFLFFRHVNAKIQLARGDQLIIDLEMEQYSPVYDQRGISDKLVKAQFYSNRGMELLAEGKARAGFLHLRKALALDDQQSYIWGNLGTLYNRQKHYRLAELAYLQGLSLQPRDLTIMSNLSTLYDAMGRPEQSDYFLQRAREHRQNNPYYLYAQAQFKLAEGDLRAAERLLETAMSLEQKEPRFYALAAEIYEQRSLPDKAEEMRREEERWSEELYL